MRALVLAVASLLLAGGAAACLVDEEKRGLNEPVVDSDASASAEASVSDDDAEPDAGPHGRDAEPGTDACVPMSCYALGVGCGTVNDTCGSMIECGSCTAPDSCGGGGEPTACGHAEATDAGPTDAAGDGCRPSPCAELGFQCGVQNIGCGIWALCGECDGTDTCGGGGTPGVCGETDACHPLTCGNMGYDCGPMNDGCGAILNCGSCPAPQVCGGSGAPGKCW